MKNFAPSLITQPILPPLYQNIDQEQLPPTEDNFIDDELNSFVFTDDEMSDKPKISLKPEETENDNIEILSSDEEVNISKSLKDTDVDFTSTPTTTVRISTKPKKKKNRFLQKTRDHPYNLKNESLRTKKVDLSNSGIRQQINSAKR